MSTLANVAVVFLIKLFLRHSAGSRRGIRMAFKKAMQPQALPMQGSGFLKSTGLPAALHYCPTINTALAKSSLPWYQKPLNKGLFMR